MIKLSKRMKAAASMVTSGNVLADIGTDHGYVPIALVQRNRVPSAIAMDINKGPLDRAREHIAMCNLQDKIETRLSDGTKALAVGEAESILIAGMGGELVIHILREGEAVCHSAKELVLQPQSDVHKVRAYLRDNGYAIVDEDMIYEDGKYYPMMRAVPAEENKAWNRLKPDAVTVCDLYGPILLKCGNPVLRKYLVKQHRKLLEILDNLHKRPESESIEKRISEIEREIEYNESAYTILGAIKDAGI
ncbi:MAG: class I SAM-dependent methyltransferase [Agathobacter sp.]|nr:class I SAM-dependent methyltransferase [Lachnobacterium sp.]MDY2912037.1 class I SAM-dependent methyltransferase [Agathobacter sp.]